MLATHVAADEVTGPGWLRGAQVVPMVGVVVLLFLAHEVVRLPGDSGLPTVHDGEWLLLDEGSGDLPRLGDFVAVRCTVDEGLTALGRVVGLPGDSLHRQGLVLCRNDYCFPTAPMVLEDEEGDQLQSASEVVGGRSHILLPASTTAGIDWSEALPVQVPDGRVALLPDNRASTSFADCTKGSIVLPLEQLLGRVDSIIYSSDWSRVGLLLR